MLLISSDRTSTYFSKDFSNFSIFIATSRENFSGLANYERSVETSKRSNNLIFDFSIHTFSLTEMVRRFP